MRKFLTVVKREYIQRVRAKMFIVSTIMLPLVMSLFAIVPAIILSIGTPPLRVAVVDRTGKMFGQLRQSFSNEQPEDANSGNTNDRRDIGRLASADFRFEEVNAANRSDDQIRADLDQRLRNKEIDGYIILAPDFLTTGKIEFFNRNPGDVFSLRRLVSALNRAVQQQRLVEANIDSTTRQGLFQSGGVAGSEDRSGRTGTRFGWKFRARVRRRIRNVYRDPDVWSDSPWRGD